MGAVAGVLSTWPSSFASTMARVECRNIGQGGNQLLAAVPQGTQAFWAGSIMAEVASVASGPIYMIAQLFRIIFNPLIAYPLSAISCAVKERFYQSSLPIKVAQQTKFYARGEEVQEPSIGTISLNVQGDLRHFLLTPNNDITWMVENSIEIEEGGEIVRYYFERLDDGEPMSADCREIQIDGEPVRVHLRWKCQLLNYVKTEAGGRTRYFQLTHEVNEPRRPTFEYSDPERPYIRRYFQIGEEIAQETPDCIRLELKEQTFHYQTGRELSEFQEGCRTFEVDGQTKYFRSAKFGRESHGISGWGNRVCETIGLPQMFPTRLGGKAVQVLEWVNENMSNVIRAAIIVSGVALLYFGHVAMAVGALAAVTYEYLDHDLGVVPSKVSLFMEKWMPMISMVGLLIVGSLTSKIMASTSLLFMIPSVNLWAHQFFSKTARASLLSLKEPLANWFFRGEERNRFDEFAERLERHPVLGDCDAPLEQRHNMSVEQLEEILSANVEDREQPLKDFELNPAHLTKNQDPILQLEQNNNFSTLLDLWDGVGERWLQENSFNRLLSRAIDDKRFILFVKERFPEASRFFYEDNLRLGHEENRAARINAQRTHREQFIDWISELAREQGVAKEAFLAQWIRLQLGHYVHKLSGDRPIEGERRLLCEAAENTSKIIPFLTREAASAVEIEDALLKLALEGGDYCALGMRRAATEVLDGFIEPLKQEAMEALGPQKAYECEVMSNLQKARLAIIQATYSDIMSMMSDRESLRDTAQDVHLYEMVTKAIRRSFYPMSSDDLRDFSLTGLVFSETMFLPGLAELFHIYKVRRIPAVMMDAARDRIDITRNRTLDYLRTWVQENEAIGEEKKQELLNGPLSNSMENLIEAENHIKWGILFLNIMGVLKKKTQEQAARHPAPPRAAVGNQPVAV